MIITDINECTTSTVEYKNGCGVNAWCNNTVGEYHCVCERYYMADLDGLACTGKQTFF